MNERSLWWLLALLILTGAVSGLIFNQPRTLFPKLARELPAPRPQAAQVRQFRPAPLEAAGLVPAGPGHKLGRPGLLEVTAEGFAYVFDYRDLQLKGVSPEGAVVPLTGADVALANPTDLVRGRDGRLWLCDPKAARLLVLEPDGRLVRSFTLAKPATRLAVSSAGRVFALTPTAEEHLFEAFDDPERPPTAAFGRLLEPPYQMPYTVDGSLAADPDGGIVYAPRYVGLLARFDAGGKLRFLVQTLEPVGPPVLIREKGRLRGDPASPKASLAIQVVGDSMLAVHPLRDGAAVLDVYSLSDGTYRESWRLERPWLKFQLSGSRLYALTERGLEIFRIGL